MAIDGVGFDSKETVQAFIDKIKSQRSETYILSNQYSGATYTTVEALLEKVAADMLAKGGYGGAVGCVWTGKSYFSGTYGTNGSTAGNARLHFENANGGYTECTFNFTSSGLGTVNWFNDVTTSTVTSGSTAPITSGAVAAVKETADHADLDAGIARGEIGDITALETTTQDDLVSAINEINAEVAPALVDVHIPSDTFSRTITKESGVTDIDASFVRSGKVCCVNFNLVHTTATKSGILLTLPSTVPIPKEPVYFTLYDSMQNASYGAFLNKNLQTYALISLPSGIYALGTVTYIAE